MKDERGLREGDEMTIDIRIGNSFELNPEYIKLIEERTMKKIPELSSYLDVQA